MQAIKRRLVPNLIGTCKQHRIILIGLLIFIAGSQTVYRPTADSPRRLRYA